MHRDEEEEKRNRKIGVKGKYVFFCMCFLNGVCREIESVNRISLFPPLRSGKTNE